MRENKDISQYTLKYLDHYTDCNHIENLPIESLYNFIYTSIYRCVNNNYTPTFEQIDIILYLLDFKEIYRTTFFLTTYEILFTHLDFNYILIKNHTKQKCTKERLKQLFEIIIKEEENIKDYVRLSTDSRITGLAYCVKNNCLKRIV